MTKEKSLDRRRFELLQQVIELDDDAREKALAASDPELAEDVRARLQSAAARGDDFLTAPPTPRPSWPERVGPYRLLERLGEGGMGVVFLAEQREPVRRRVAVKVLRRAISGRQARARFSAERHAMGRLSHPNVGKLLDAGTTEEGLPFFAMELIDGLPITTYCDRQRLGLKARLRLFVAACRGVEHAHKKLLLHRDIKPSNILVADIDGEAVPKLIDFGIAKGLDEALTDITLATGAHVLGTPSYMSPEALGLGGDVDIRSDQFSLGVVLYELLTGQRPWPDAEATPVSTIRQRSEDAEGPSRRVGRLEGSERDTVARQRGESAEGLAKRLRGDLDRITLQAIADRPAERYSSVANLADDVERFLADVPITAQAPTSAYLLRKLVRRHRGRVIAAALLMVSLLLGTVGTAIGFVKARAEAERASQEAEAARSARDDALAARSSSDLLADFFVDLFSSDSSSTTAGEVLARDTEALSVRLEGQPRTQGILLQRLAGIYAEWGDLAKADRLLEQAVTLLESADGAPFPETLDAYEVWISVRWKQARFREAGQLTEQALAFADRLEPPAGADRLAKVLGQGGIAMLYIARWNQAERWFQQGQTLLEGAPGDSPDHGSAQTLIEVGLAGLAYDRGQWQEGIDRYRRTAQGLEQRFGPAHRRLAVLWPFIAYGEMKLGHLDEAERLLERSHELGERYWFDDGHKLAQILSRTALLYREQGRFAEAEALQRRSLKSRKEVLPATHPAIAGDLSQLAWTLWLSNQGRVDEVVEILEEARRMLVEIDEPVYPLHRDIPTRLGEVALAQGRAEDALSLFRQACAYIEGLEAPIAADLGLCHLHRGRGLWAMNRPEQARAAWEEAERQFEAAGAAPELAEVRTLLAQTPGST